MEKKLSQLFDLQRFQQNPKLRSVLEDVESRYAGALADDDLELVSAAGDTQPTQEFSEDEIMVIQDEIILIIPHIHPEGERS